MNSKERALELLKIIEDEIEKEGPTKVLNTGEIQIMKNHPTKTQAIYDTLLWILQDEFNEDKIIYV